MKRERAQLGGVVALLLVSWIVLISGVADYVGAQTQITPGLPAARVLPTGCANGQTATYTSSSGTWGCTTVVGGDVVGAASGYKLARGSTALDGTNPTTVATGLSTVVSCAGTLLRNTAITTGTAFVTHDAASGANVDWYGWVFAGTASTGTETFEWVCVGT